MEQANTSGKTELNVDEDNQQSKNWFTNKIERIMLISLNIGTLVAFIIVSTCQFNQTQDAITLADSSFSVTKESLDLTKETVVYDLRPYISVKKVYLKEFKVGKPISYSADIINTGKTPAYQVSSDGGTKVGGSGIYETDFQRYIAGIKLNTTSLGNGLIFQISMDPDEVLLKLVKPFYPKRWRQLELAI